MELPALEITIREHKEVIIKEIIKETGGKVSEELASRIVDEMVNIIHKAINLNKIEMKCPVELRVYDSEGKVTGLVDGKIKNEIPMSFYRNRTVTIFSPAERALYTISLFGTDTGTYRLNVISVRNGDVSGNSTIAGLIEKEKTKTFCLKEHGTKMKFYPSIFAIEHPEKVVVGDRFRISLNASDPEGIKEVTFKLLDPLGSWHNYTASYSSGPYKSY